ncbi:AAA family ATPase [Treponema sp.]|uniref:AAA family ATPase n=1 Tax=Treponema sp. TaxID=166 RepID=UPI00259A7AF1|nr:AAA family ATPase [uncultured Treponema sp.]
MLAKFAVENFRGFENKIEIDLTRPANYEFNKEAVKDGIIKNGIIYGPNGCGKSNFGLAIFDIVDHLTQKKKDPLHLRNYVFAGAQKSPVVFEYTFKFSSDTLFYSYKKNFQGILQEEKLTVNDKIVFERRLGTFTLSEEFPLTDTLKSGFSRNANNVSIINFLLTSYPLPEEHYLIKLQNFVNGMLWFRCLEDREFIGLESLVEIIDTFIIKNKLIKDFARFLDDVSGQKFDFSPTRSEDKLLRCFIKGSPVIFTEISSTGTHSLTLLYYWLQKMSKASFVFIDEFDAFYHFKLSFNVCKELLKLNCQIFTSSHNTYLMTNELLRPDCNFLLDKNIIKPLYECTEKELRWGHNIEKLFRGGTFTV